MEVGSKVDPSRGMGPYFGIITNPVAPAETVYRAETQAVDSSKEFLGLLLFVRSLRNAGRKQRCGLVLLATSRNTACNKMSWEAPQSWTLRDAILLCV